MIILLPCIDIFQVPCTVLLHMYHVHKIPSDLLFPKTGRHLKHVQRDCTRLLFRGLVVRLLIIMGWGIDHDIRCMLLTLFYRMLMPMWMLPSAWPWNSPPTVLSPFQPLSLAGLQNMLWAEHMFSLIKSDLSLPRNTPGVGISNHVLCDTQDSSRWYHTSGSYGCSRWWD